MKKFKFTLEGLLKIRSLKEQECKTEIGKLQVEIEQIKNAIGQNQQGIASIYASQEELLKDGVSGQELKFFPYFFEGKKAQIKILERELSIKQAQLEELFEELSKRRADLKVITNMKEKQLTQHKKENMKKELQTIEEQVQNWAIGNKR